MKVVSNFIFTILLTLNLSAALEVVTSRIDRGGIQGFHGDVKVHSGATWAILGTTLCSFFGGLEVEKGASLFIKSDNGPVLALNVALSTLVRPVINNGVISLNSKSSTSFSNFDIGGSSFTNNGEIYLASSGLVKSTAYLYAREWTNNGLIVAYQNQKAAGNIAFGTAYQTITNNGQICLRHQDFVPATKIKGTGCVTADEDTWIKLGNTILSVEPTHNFYLKDSKSSLIVHAVSSNQTFTVHGFGNGNKLGLTLPLTGNRDHFRFEYYPDTGILQLRAAALPQYFKIGKGYDSKLFRIVNSRGLKNAVTYDGPVPNNEIPAVCLIPCTNGPSAPESESDLNTPTTSSIETSSYSSAATESSVVSESSSARVVSSTTNIESSSTAIETTMNSESSTDAETSSSESMSASSTTASNTSIETDSGIVSQSESSSNALSSTEQSITSSPGQSTIYVNSTVTSTITSCDENKCTEDVVTIFTTVPCSTDCVPTTGDIPMSTSYTQRTVTSTITNCDEVSCSQDVVTYTTNVPHTTVDATTTTTTSTGGDNSTGGNESGSNHGAGSNEGSQSGPNNGSGSGSEGGSNNGSGSEGGSGSNEGSQSGSGSQPGPNEGSEGGSGSNEGSNHGSNEGSGSGSGSGSNNGSGSGSQSGSGSGSQSGSESGSNSGSNEGSNPGAGNGSNEGSGQGSGNGSEAGSGQGSGPNNGSGSGHNDGSGSGSNQGSNPGAGSGSGSESGSNAGSHSGSNEGAKTDSIEGFHTESKPGFNTGAHTDATVTGNSVANPVTTSTESDTTISVTVSITSYMTGFDGKPKPFTTVDVIPVPHSMPSNTTDSSSSVPTIDTNENGSSIVTGGKSILFGLIVSMVVLFM
ncbi:Hyphally regulated cell wall protein 1 [Candida albicans]|uniref:Hyphally regulated cell wall protein 1 n=1 Tax=Candida albicans TaxID=5476 RepID=A0A8H6BZF3_CANAX|nr:Hyphally regulated cell wall protein 1 [Candida albicans]